MVYMSKGEKPKRNRYFCTRCCCMVEENILLDIINIGKGYKSEGFDSL